MSAPSTPAKTSTTIAPFLSVRNGAKAIEFYKSAFGATETFRHDDPGGSGSVVARLSVNGAEFWVADESPEHKNFSPETLSGSTTRMVMVVDDPDAAFQRAVNVGAKVIVAMENNYGWRLGRVLDPYGHHWEIGKPTAGSPE
jgi:PhnB protein